MGYTGVLLAFQNTNTPSWPRYMAGACFSLRSPAILNTRCDGRYVHGRPGTAGGCGGWAGRLHRLRLDAAVFQGPGAC